MKKIFFLLVNLLVVKFLAQDPTRVLFLGNSFTSANNLPSLFKGMADSAELAVSIAAHIPGGISVGDVSQGTAAHMNNPIVFNLIRAQKWDYVVIQDNQGRFVEDSAVFPTSFQSKVIQGHLNIMDSVKANNSCAKVILFAGWGWKNGYPQLANTGIEIIDRILTNYVVLNDTMKETVAPIGEAWKKVVNYLPGVNLWAPDDAHPSYEGTYLTTSVIFSTIFEMQTKTINYNGTLNPLVAYNLRAFSDSAVFNSTAQLKYNLGGIQIISPVYNNGQLSFSGNFVEYNWYKNNQYISNTPVLVLTGHGDYKAVLKASDGSILKTCVYSYSSTDVPTGLVSEKEAATFEVFPNPITSGLLTIMSNAAFENIELISVSGQAQKIVPEITEGKILISTKEFAPGCYFLILKSAHKAEYKKIVIAD